MKTTTKTTAMTKLMWIVLAAALLAVAQVAPATTHAPAPKQSVSSQAVGGGIAHPWRSPYRIAAGIAVEKHITL